MLAQFRAELSHRCGQRAEPHRIGSSRGGRIALQLTRDCVELRHDRRGALVARAVNPLGAIERGAFGFSNEKSLTYCVRTPICGVGTCAIPVCGAGPPLVADILVSGLYGSRLG